MKKLTTILLGAMLLVLASCNDLEISPKNLLTGPDIFSNQAGVDAYIANMYTYMPIEDYFYRNENGRGYFKPDDRGWEQFYHPGATCSEMAGPYHGADGGSGFGYWPYDHIRTVNYLLQELPNNAGNFKNGIDEWMGEAYYLRAYLYYSLAKRYGGVPIIETVQNYPEQSLEELQVSRDKEVDVWNFIEQDLKKAYEMMPEKSARGRANRYVAAALQSRAMIYAGCVARYGSSNFVAGDARDQGLVGISESEAPRFFKSAQDAAKLLEGRYDLYKKKYPDKEQNFVDLFLDQDSPENILVRDYSLTTNTAHSWDATMTCRPLTADGLSRTYPSYDLVKLYGGALPVVNADGTPRRFTNRSELKEGLEPRLLATVYFPGDELRGGEFDIQRGLYEQFSGTAAAETGLNPPNRRYRHTAGSTDAMFEGRRIIGLCGVSEGGDDFTRTGFYVRKYIDYNKPQEDCGLYRSTQAWIDMRYAEVLLNRAEAAIELGDKADALACVNLVRDRAGAKLLTDVTVNDVRLERRKETAFEKNLWWDLKRWRISDKELDNTRLKALYPYYVINEGKYIFLEETERDERSYTFEKKYYYEPIPGGELNKNPNLYPNNPNY